MNHTIDATGKIVGRLATEVAMLLMGKRSPSYRPNVIPEERVLVTNLSKARFSGTKMQTKTYYRFTGYETGIHPKELWYLWEKDATKVFQRIVAGMLPKNRLRPFMLKRLKVTL